MTLIKYNYSVKSPDKRPILKECMVTADSWMSLWEYWFWINRGDLHQNWSSIGNPLRSFSSTLTKASHALSPLMLPLAEPVGCRRWLHPLAADVGCRCWLHPLAADVGCTRWLQMLAADVGCRRWLHPLAADVGCTRWLHPFTAPLCGTHFAASVSSLA